jgi:hypothetical protein
MSGIWQCVEKVPSLLMMMWLLLTVPWLLVGAAVYGLYCAAHAGLSRWPAMQALVGSVGSWGTLIMSGIWWCAENLPDLLLTGRVEKVAALLLQVLLVLAVPWLLVAAVVYGLYYAVRAGLSRVCSWGMYVTSGIKRCGGKTAALLLKVLLVLLVLAVPVLLAMAVVELCLAPGSTTAGADCRAAAAARAGVDAVLDFTIVTMIGLNSVGTLLVAAAAAADGVACSVGCMRAMRQLVDGWSRGFVPINAAGLLVLIITCLLASGAPCRYFTPYSFHESH